MCQLRLPNATLYQQLQQADEGMAAEAREQPCRHCGGPLHVANFHRKPRGGPKDLPAGYTLRYSLCCGRCRRRSTPPSVRYLGRRVYVGAIVVVVSLCRHGVTARRVARLRQLLDDGGSSICRETVERWRAWWQERLPSGAFWRGHRAHFVPPVEEKALPASVLERFGGEGEEPLAKLLAWLSPVSTLTAPGALAL